MLDYYGIVLDSNVHDNVRLGVTLDKEDKLFGAKMDLLKSRGLRKYVRCHACQSDVR